MSETFYNGYKLAVKNAKDHLKVAKICAEKRLYGIGNSHLILASEEGIKSVMLFAKHKKPNIKIEDFDKFFRDHKHKHNEILQLEKSFYFMQKMVMITLTPAFKRYKKKGKLEIEEALALRDKGVDNLEVWLKSIIANKGETGFDETWFNNANNRKNLGFYVHYEKTGGWHTPAMIRKKEFTKSLQLVERLLDFFNQFEKLYEEPQTQDMIRMMDEKGIFD